MQFCVKLGKTATETFADLRAELTVGRGKKSAQKVTIKTLILTFFDYSGMVYTHTVPNQAVNADDYISVLKQMMKNHIHKMWSDFVGNWKFHHDLARPHVSNKVIEFFTRKIYLQTTCFLPHVEDPLKKWLSTCFTGMALMLEKMCSLADDYIQRYTALKANIS